MPLTGCDLFFYEVDYVKGVLIHEEAFIDWEDGADALEAIIEKLMQKNSGYGWRGSLRSLQPFFFQYSKWIPPSEDTKSQMTKHHLA